MSVRRYEAHATDLVEGFCQLRDNQDLFDVTVIVGGKPFKAHKAVLASLSGYFKVMFTNPGFTDMAQSQIEIKEEKFTPESFEQLLDFMYTGSVKITSTYYKLVDMLQLAWFLQVPGAVSVCVDLLSDTMKTQDHPFNFVYYLYCTATEMDHDTLKSHADRCICHNLIKFVEANPKELFEQMPKDYLEEILRREDLNQAGPEDEILEVVVRWLQFDWDSRKDNAESLLRNIRLGTIPDHVLSDVLEEELYAMAKKLLSEQKALLDQAASDRKAEESDKPRGKDTNRLEFMKNEVMKGMWEHQSAWPFLKPVEADGEGHAHLGNERVNLQEYRDVVKRPMDLGTIKEKLESNGYISVAECVADFQQMFSNVYAFSKPGDEILSLTKNVNGFFVGKLSELPDAEVPDAEMDEKTSKVPDIREEKTLWTHRGTVTSQNNGLTWSAQILLRNQARQGFRVVRHRDKLMENMQLCMFELSKEDDRQIYPYHTLARINDYGRTDDEEEDERVELDEDYQTLAYQLVTNLPRFLVAKSSTAEVPGWSLATYAEVEACYGVVKTYLSGDRVWYICKLQDGRIAGSGYQYEMKKNDHQGLGHQLLIQYPCSFSIIKTGKLLAGWCLATFTEVETNLELVKCLFKGKKGKYVCLVQGGKLHGADKDFQLEEGMFYGLEHQLVVKYESKLADGKTFKNCLED